MFGISIIAFPTCICICNGVQWTRRCAFAKLSQLHPVWRLLPTEVRSDLLFPPPPFVLLLSLFMGLAYRQMGYWWAILQYAGVTWHWLGISYKAPTF